MGVTMYPENIKEFAYQLYKANFSLKKIQEEIKNRFGLDVKKNTIKQWIHRFKKKEQAEKNLKQKGLPSVEEVLKEIEQETGEYFYSDYEEKKQEVKQASKKTQTKPQTAVDRIINKEITEVATDMISDYIVLGKELKQKLEEHAKAYGYSNVRDFVLFLFEFWDKHKYDIEKLKKLEEENEELKLKIKLLKLLLSPKFDKIVEKLFFEKALREQVNLAMLFKMSDNSFDSEKMIEAFISEYLKNKYNNKKWLL